MRTRYTRFVSLLLLAAARAAAQPVISPDGILNSASYTVSGLPNSGIAQGSMFVVFGMNLGPGKLVLAPSLPLPVDLAGTSVQVSSGGTTLSAYLYYSYSTQIAAILPSATPAGDAMMTVSYHGRASAPVRFSVVRGSLGIFTRNQAGGGPAILQNYKSPIDQPLNDFTEPARPGQVEILWATGLGPITGDDSGFPPVGNLPGNVEVLVGGKTAKLLYAGRSPQFPSIDQINFEVPPGVEGCHVPIAVTVDAVTSNFATMAVASAGSVCSDPTGFSAADLGQFLSKGEAKVASINLGRVHTGSGSVAGIAESTVEEGSGVFFRRTADRIFGAGVEAYASLGSCMVFTLRAGDPIEWVPVELAGNDTGLDAGTTLNVSGPGGTRQLSLTRQGSFSGTLGGGLPGGPVLPVFLAPGDYTVDNGAGGGDVGAFRANLTVPSPLVWANRDSLGTVPRGDLTVQWTGGDPNRDFVFISGASMVLTPSQAIRAFVCTERAAAGYFTVPATVLRSLPASAPRPAEGVPTGMLAVGSQSLPGPSRFTAPGLDVGYLRFVGQDVKYVDFR